MVPEGADPHSYEPKPSQMANVAAAKVYFTIGLEFEEAWLPRIRGTNQAMQAVAMDAGIRKRPMEAHHHHEHGEEGHDHDGDHDGEHDGDHDGEHDHEFTPGELGEEGHMRSPEGDRHAEYMSGMPVPGEHEHEHEAEHEHAEEGHHHHHGMLDPHVWTAPRNMEAMMENTLPALIALLPEHEGELRAARERLRDDIRRVEFDVASRLASTATDETGQRAFLVFHPSWGYFAEAYGLRQVPIEVEGSEPSPRELAAIVAKAREMRARAIFVQPQISQKSARVVAGEVGAEVVEADPLAHDWDANLRAVAARFAEVLR
jgi:zinc transport system substrate-binding protein